MLENININQWNKKGSPEIDFTHNILLSVNNKQWEINTVLNKCY